MSVCWKPGWCECPECGPLVAVTTYGMCTACGSVEVALANVTGTRDMSAIGESPEYPVGYGCEVCG